MNDSSVKRMSAAIVTGANGFVGSYTVNEFIAHGVRVLALDRAEAPSRLIESDLLEYKKCDVFNSSELLNSVRPGEYDTFVHFAWAGSAGPARTDYGLQVNNALGTVECLKAAKSLGCTRFVCAGSIMELEVEAAVHAQGNHPGMGYIYGTGKLLAHCLCKMVAAEVGIDLLWPMITNAYGIGELSPRFVNTTLRKILQDEPLEFTAATQGYDFVYVTDVARAFYLIAQKGVPFCEYVIGSGQARPLREFILEMLDACAPKLECRFGDVPFTGTDMPLDSFDVGPLEQDCGFTPEIGFAQGTRMTMEWLADLGGE